MVTALLQETQNTTEGKFQVVGKNWMSNLWRKNINENTKMDSLVTGTVVLLLIKILILQFG